MTGNAPVDVRLSPAPHVEVVDVGHGSCTVVRSGGSTVLVDTGPNGAVLEYLLREGITSVDMVVISHADADHIGGLSALLSQGIPIGRIIWNGDSAKHSDIWRDLVYQIDDLHMAGVTLAGEEAIHGMSVETADGRVQLSVIAPRLRLQRLGPGSYDANGASVSTNSVSVVIRVVVDGEPLLLVPGDIDAVGFAHLSDPDLPDLRARYLLLPHHGGLMGTAALTAALITDLVCAVDPEIVLISNGRGRYDNPRRDVVEAVRAGKPAMPIACTQLSRLCSAVPLPRIDSVEGSYARGWLTGHSCAGTMRIVTLGGSGALRERPDHLAFIESRVSSPLCIPTT